MNKKDFIEKVAIKTGESLKNTEKFVNAFLEVVGEGMKKEEEIKLVGFGTWKVQKRVERSCRNPKTGETMKVLAKKVIKFKAGKKLDCFINQ